MATKVSENSGLWSDTGTQAPQVDIPLKGDFWKHCWNKRNAGYQHFLLFPLCFLLYLGKIFVT